jgi:C1A family cysteine protease
MKVLNQMKSLKQVWFQIPTANEKTVGGHAVYAVGYNKCVIISNKN